MEGTAPPPLAQRLAKAKVRITKASPTRVAAPRVQPALAALAEVVPVDAVPAVVVVAALAALAEAVPVAAVVVAPAAEAVAALAEAAVAVKLICAAYPRAANLPAARGPWLF